MVLVDIIGVNKLPKAIAILTLAEGIGMMMAPPVAGLYETHTHAHMYEMIKLVKRLSTCTLTILRLDSFNPR